jgi:cytochrome c oxidase subunit 3
VKRRLRHAGDVSGLPDYSFGPTALGWWGVVGFMLIEGTGFVLAIGAYYYLLPIETDWPPASHAPPLLWGTLFTLVGLASEIPNVRIHKKAMAQDLPAVRFGLVVMSAIGLGMLGLRALEMSAMNVRWDYTAYGSIVWALLVLHTFHTVTDVYDSLVLTVMAWREPMDGRRFSDVTDNALYWHFIVWSWVVLYVVIYWTPRWI